MFIAPLPESAMPTQTPVSLRPTLTLLESREVPSRTLFVDDDRQQIPSAAFTTIQAAVNAARRGDDIVVARGTYREQVNIPADKDDITLKSRNPRQAVIEAPAVLTGGKAIVSVNGADRVTVDGFTVTGPAVAGSGLDAGIGVFDGGSATIENNLITRIRNNPLDGLQVGFGVIVDGDGMTTSATVSGNTITHYQKGGVLVYGPDARARVEGNVIRGTGPTGLIAQTGVQVSGGADAVVAGNSISGNSYTGGGTFAAGVLVQSAGRVSLQDNRVFANQQGVVVFDTNGVSVTGNQLTGNSLDGLDLIGVRGGLVAGNLVRGNATDGVVLSDARGVLVAGNVVRDNGGDGLVLTDGSSGNLISFNSLRGNGRYDAFDDTTGPLTGGTANWWAFNAIGTKNVPGLR